MEKSDAFDGDEGSGEGKMFDAAVAATSSSSSSSSSFSCTWLGTLSVRTVFTDSFSWGTLTTSEDTSGKPIVAFFSIVSSGGAAFEIRL